jgi:L-fuculose-phosphate aldolase
MAEEPDEPRAALAGTLRRIYQLGLTTTSGGNLSIRTADGDLWITPAGLDKGSLHQSEVARIAADGRHMGGPPSSSELPFHRAIYAARPDLGAIVHAHPVSLVAFSVVHELPDTRISAAAHALCGRLGFAPYALPGSPALGDAIAAAFAASAECVVLENHGAVVAGASLRQAFERLEALDLTARTLLRARTLGRARTLSDDDLALHSVRDSAAGRGETARADPEERELGEALCALARRSNEKRLMTSRQGALSARLPDDRFLLTPSHLPLDGLTPADLDCVALDAAAGREALHAALYRAHPEVGAVAHGIPENTGGFGVSGAPLPTRTIPESYILVRDPARLAFRTTRLEPESVAAQLCPDRPVAVVENDGALSLGRSALEAFDRLEVLEATAAAVIASRPLGELSPLGEEAIGALREVFFPKGGL